MLRNDLLSRRRNLVTFVALLAAVSHEMRNILFFILCGNNETPFYLNVDRRIKNRCLDFAGDKKGKYFHLQYLWRMAERVCGFIDILSCQNF
jgi:hypothetical protein